MGAKKYIDKPLLFLSVFVFFIASIVVLVLGIRDRMYPKLEEDSQHQTNDETGYEDIFLSDYFSATKEEADLKDQKYLRDDPFRESCAPTSGDDLPSVTSNTVCLR